LGDTWTRPDDAMVMVYVPAGEYAMGSADGNSDEQPVHTVELDGFWIDETEVTNTQYRWCVEAGVCQPPITCDWGASPYDDMTKIYHPVTCVDWDGAVAYCGWVGGRLPTEAEWEYAARGPEALIYPWGDSKPSCSQAHFANCEEGALQVGELPDGASWVGALDMAGNVWEWVADWYSRSYYDGSPEGNPTGPESGENRVLRGGGWYFDDRYLRSAVRYKLPAVHRIDYVGFRCVVPE
jgi:serine/threonine-protein kinase